jgi:hypothetical protein
MTVTQLLDYALPYSAEDRRCGLKKKNKTEKRMKLAVLLNNARKGRSVDLKQVKIMTDYATFEQKVAAWIAGSKTS